MNRRSFLIGSGSAALVACARGHTTPMSPGTARLRAALSPHVLGGDVPGLVGMVARKDELETVALGSTEEGGEAPALRDTIFRIASMTKPITAVATMILVEQGTLALDAPVETWLPELANRRVLKKPDSELDDTEPAARAITVRDLLTFTWGFGIPMAPPGTLPIQRAIDELQLCQKMPKPSEYAPPDEWMRQLGTLPLMHQPGARWMYNTGSDVLGVLIARASKRSLAEFLHDRVFVPLDMRDTGFVVPASQLERFTASYTVDGKKLKLYDAIDGEWSKPPPFPSGAAGLVSSADDLHAFGMMMLQRGGKVLSERAVAEMTRDQLTPEQRAASNDFVHYFVDHSWGFGMAVVTGKDLAGPPGTFGWDGGLGTSWRTDPTRQLVSILLTNRSFTSPEPPQVVQDFWKAV